MGLNNAGRASQAHQAMLERRAKIAQLRLSGVRNQREVMRQLAEQGIKASLGTINSDFKALDEQYQQVATQDIAKAKGMDLERIEELILALWLDARNGKLPAVDRVVLLLDRRAKLLGLDAPTKTDITLHIRQVAEQMGLDPDEAVKEAQRIVAGRR